MIGLTSSSLVLSLVGPPPKDQILLTTAPKSHGLASLCRNATDGPEPHLLMPSAEFVAVVNNIWSFGGPPGSSDRTNELLINPIISYHFADGWAVSSSPNITANWIASGGKWTVPVGGGFSKIIHLGEKPIKLELDAYYNAIRPTASEDTWLLQATLSFIFAENRRPALS